MRRLLNTLYILTEDAYLSLDGENVVVKVKGRETGRIPFHTLESIVSFSYAGASPALMGACAKRDVSISFYSPRGSFLARIEGRPAGNIVLRRRHYQVSESPRQCLEFARSFIIAKIYNAKWVIERAIRDHGLRLDVGVLKSVSSRLSDAMREVLACDSIESLRGIEGAAAADYFSVFGELVLREPEFFSFAGRERRPPRDPVNSLLSFFYTVLANDCASALEGVGLDPRLGFLHVDRAGRNSLALDVMEELRPVFVDRFVLTSINNQIVAKRHFEIRETGEVRLTDEGRKRLFKAWQDRKQEKIRHPFLEETIAWGLVPHVQAQLLCRTLRDDLDAYPSFLWK